MADGRYWIYQHDSLGQVVSGMRYRTGGTLMAGQEFDYKFDDIGNRDTTGGRASAVSDYTANQLNQYTTRTVANQLDVLGVANPKAGVQVWKDTRSPAAATQKGEYFHHALTAGNGTYPDRHRRPGLRSADQRTLPLLTPCPISTTHIYIIPVCGSAPWHFSACLGLSAATPLPATSST